MSWLRVDDGFAEHPKLEALTDRQFRLWAKLLGRCARYHTDGHVPAGILVGIRVKPGDLERFRQLGLLDSNNGAEPSVHDWSEYNPKDPTKAARQARWRAKQASTDDAEVDAPVDAGVDDGDGLQSVSRVRARARGPSPTPEEQPPPPPEVQDLADPEDDELDPAVRALVDQTADALAIGRAVEEDIPF